MPPPDVVVSRSRALAEQWVAIVVAVAAAVMTGLLITAHQSKSIAIMPIAVVAAGGMVLLALTDFTAFVILVLGIRAMMDWSKSAPTHVTGAGVSSGNLASALAVMFMGASIVWLLAQRRHRTLHPGDASRRGVLVPALLLFLAAGGLSVLGSHNKSGSGLEFLRIASAVMMLVVLERIMVDRKTVKRVLAACILAGVVPGLVAVTQLAGGGGLFTAGGYSRIRGTFVHPNPYALFLTFSLILACAMFFQTPPKLRVWLGLLMVGDALALLLTYTRTGWVATAVGVFVLCVLNKKTAQFLAVSAVLGILLLPVIIGRISDLGRLQRSNGTAGNSLIWRVGYWTQILPLADRNPITGIGLKQTQASVVEQKEPHNDFIRAYVETGLLGFLAYVGVQLAVWTTVRRALRATKDRGGFDRAVATGFAGAAAAFTLVSVASNVISSAVLLWYLFAMAAAATVITTMAPEAPPEDTQPVDTAAVAAAAA